MQNMPLLVTTADTSSQQRGVLQERSVNQPHECYNSTASSQLKQHGSPGPAESAAAQRTTTAGAYYTGNVHASHVGLAGFGVEKSEKQIRVELERIFKMIARSDSYQKYREKQPVLNHAEVIARDAAEEKERARKEAAGEKPDKKDNTVWPDFLEHAFWRATNDMGVALVRWPPMGRKKHMLEGKLRGRNELIQNSISRDTGIRRDRKRVSSHLQVLKKKLEGFNLGSCTFRLSFHGPPLALFIGCEFASSLYALSESQLFGFAFFSPQVLSEDAGGGFAVAIPVVIREGWARACQKWTNRKIVLAYMSLPEDPKKRRRGKAASYAYHSSHLRGRQHAQRTDSIARYEHDTSSPHLWPHLESSNLALGVSSRSDSSSPFTVTEFAMTVDGEHQPVHCFTRMHPNGRLDSLDIADFKSWHRQYPEFDFLQAQTETWAKHYRKVLVCDASIKVMTEARPKANLTITFDLHSQVDLSGLASLECTTRFYDSGDMTSNSQLDPMKHEQKEHRTSCEYHPDPRGSSGHLRIAFGSPFWVMRLAKYQNLRHKDEKCVRDSLLRLTATQDIYGIMPGTGDAQCLFTILWRFQQIRNSAEVGSMKWRSVSFARCIEQGWCQEMEYKTEEIEGGRGELDNVPPVAEDISLYQQASQLPLEFQHPPADHSYGLQPHQEHPTPSLSLDILASMQPDLDHVNASATTTATDFSRQSFALAQTQDLLPSNTHNDFDFDGGHITISGAFEPAINLSAYDGFGIASQSAGLESLHALAGLEHDELANMGLAVGEHGQLVAVDASNHMQDPADLACYSTKPNWHHTNLISHLENAAEQYHPYLAHDEHSHSRQGHEVIHVHDMYQQVSQEEGLVVQGLHDAHVGVNHGLWGLQGLQSPFEGDTGSGAPINEADCRREQAHGLGFGVLDLIERDQRSRGY
ncbi:Regulatory abaA [Pyrenophora seminiperda CCB06]|uniref:Regulatory abaA n=1 Tax=Pyrenophora seminiperda CCB06 TaxID=1302712 RepID=A0A3M7MH11_9PLEO|nr:Regulatory abaA [Pyrenophora seminiperda CCB06]